MVVEEDVVVVEEDVVVVERGRGREPSAAAASGQRMVSAGLLKVERERCKVQKGESDALSAALTEKRSSSSQQHPHSIAPPSQHPHSPPTLGGK